MPPSWRTVHYAQRPAKATERKLMASAVEALQPLFSPSDLRYVGFGSPFFADFRLFHRIWDCRTMVNIEDAAQPKDHARFEFNLPYGHVDLRWGHSNDVLPSLLWDVPTVCWLDHDKTLSTKVLVDIDTVAAAVQAPCVLAVSVQVNPEPLGERVSTLRERIDPEKLPAEWATEPALANWGTARASADLLTQRLDRAVRTRNGGLDETDDAALSVEQILHFHYEDDARMLTLGWVLLPNSDARLNFAQSRVSDLDYVRQRGAPAFVITVPNLTIREMRYLDMSLPSDTPDPRDLSWLPEKEVAQYRSLYRHLPAFVDVDI